MPYFTVRRAVAVGVAVLAVGTAIGAAAQARPDASSGRACGWLETFPLQPAPCPSGTPSPGDGGGVGYDVTTGQTTGQSTAPTISASTAMPGSGGPGGDIG